MIIRNRYRLEKYLEHGPVADVFLAEDHETGQMVVIRRMAAHIRVDTDVLAAFVGDSARLRLLNLPTIAAYEDVFVHEGQLHLVRPFLPGPPLDKFLAEHGPLPPARFREWALSLARTMAAVHVEEVVHGDLRPNNIYVVPKSALSTATAARADLDTTARDAIQDDDEISLPVVRPQIPQEEHPADTPGEYRLVITNFSLYRLLENRRLVTTTARLNVSNYTSPQRWQGQKTTFSDDIWNLGVLFFQMSSGRLPFDAPNDAAIMNRVLYQATPNLRGRVPRGMVAIIERLLEKDPWRRYRSIGAVVSDLERGSVRWPGRRSGLMPRERNPVVSWLIFGLFLLLLLGIPAGGGAALVASNQPTLTPMQIAGVIISPTPTQTPTPVILPFSPSQGGQPTDTLTPSPTWTPVVITNTPTTTPTPSDTPTSTPSPTITASPTATETATATATATYTATATASATATPTGTATATPTATTTATATATATQTASPSATATSTATATATLNMTATADFAAFLTRQAVIQQTQIALETRQAATPTPDVLATNAALTPTAAVLRPMFHARTDASALPLCNAGENPVSFTDFTSLTDLPGSLPSGFLQEFIDLDPALHLTRTGSWALPVPPAYVRVQFDMLAPRAVTPPLTVSFVPVGTATNRTGWRLRWAVSDRPERTGLLLEQVTGGQPETVSSLLPVPFNEWVTVSVGFEPLGPQRSVLILNTVTAGGETGTALLVIDNQDLVPFSAVAFNATIDSAPWLDNVLVCQRPGLPVVTPQPGS
ncbi:MAG: hypothetical protein Kow0077_11220 [Anaerolineae bacterium]